ncbi:MAG: histidine kinase dimerization/phosphoacceptor domain -containing protein [Dehalococcoidia bacterium]|nr:histidine kinase dimerization/phosphoacceptor domain -containing protein [Dehalococcoidia bacterium]
MRISNKILLVVLTAAVLSGSTAAFIGRQIASDALTREAKDNLLTISQSRARSVQNFVDYQLANVQVLADQATLYYTGLEAGQRETAFSFADDGSIRTIVQSITASSTYVWQALYVAAEGYVVASSVRAEDQAGQSPANQIISDWAAVDYSQIDWSAVDPTEIDWSKVDYSQIDWSRLDLGQVDFARLDWSQVDISRVDLSQVDLSNVDWTKFDLSKIDLSKVNLNTLNWRSIDLSDMEWDFIDMRRQDVYLKGREGPYIGRFSLLRPDIQSEALANDTFVLGVSAPFFAGNQLKGVMVYLGGQDELNFITGDKSGLGDTGEVYLIDEEGLMLTPSRFLQDAVLKQQVSVSPGIGDETQYAVVSSHNYMGDSVLGVYHQIPGTPWTMVVEKNHAEIVKPVGDLTRTILIAMLGLLVLCNVMAVFLSRAISVPIVRLRKGAEQIMKGDWDYPVESSSNDEVGQLSRSFSAMTDALKRSQQDLHQKNAVLEERIAEREVLLKEIHHRVKNNLQIIASLLNLQKRSITDQEARLLFEESGRRVQSMALIHEQLYRSGDLAKIDFKQYLRSLADNLIRTYANGSSGIALNLHAENIFLSIDTAVPCGLMVNELITNSLKYAFPEGWQRDPSNKYAPAIDIRVAMTSDHHLTLVVADNGIGLPEGLDIYNTETLGLQLVTSLSSQLSASVEVDRTLGTTFRITIPQGDPS